MQLLFGKENITYLVFLPWVEGFTCCSVCFMTLWAFETLFFKESEKITIFLSPSWNNSGAQRWFSPLHSCTFGVFAQLERLIISGSCHLTGSEVLLASAGSPETVFNNSRDCNKAPISADISPAGVKWGQRSIYVKWLHVWSLESLFISLEGANQETEYEFMALLCDRSSVPLK